MHSMRWMAIVALVLTIAGTFLTGPVSPFAWTPVSAQTAPRPSVSDRIFLKIDGIEGESTENDHAGDLQVQSFSWGISRSTDTSAPATVKDMHIVMAMDKASPLLLRKAGIGERIAKATLNVRNSLGQDYTKWTMSDIVLTGFQAEGTIGHGKPMISFDMHVNKVDIEYRPQLYSGGLGPAVRGGWEAKGR